jgi:AraC-like DNA-binding protein
MTQVAIRSRVENIAPGEGGFRNRLFDLSVGLVEDLSSRGAMNGGTTGFSPDFQIALPYRGLFVWHVGHDEVVGDANQAIFVTGGEDYRLSQPVRDGFAELIITPAPWVVAELAHATGGPLRRHALFRRRSRRLNPSLQSFGALFLRWATGPSEVDALAAEEVVLALIRSALDEDAPLSTPAPSTERLIRRTKAFLQSELAQPIRLMDIGRAVGASPAYLTQVFRQVEGIPLHQYLTQLRLARALIELPETDDLTGLAMEVGFSSHSHFSASFHRSFGRTPSQFRELSRRRVLPTVEALRVSGSGGSRDPQRALKIPVHDRPPAGCS